MGTQMQPQALDHIALWVEDRTKLADFCVSYLGMHIIDETETFTLVGSDARRGKLTLFEASGQRATGVLQAVILAVRDLEVAIERLPANLSLDHSSSGEATFIAPEGLRMGLIERPNADLDYDLDHVRLIVPDPSSTFAQLTEFGFSERNGCLAVEDKYLTVEQGHSGSSERPLLNHLALLVASAQDHIEEARNRGLHIVDIVDAPNTYAVFIMGPDQIKLEYVEHKPTFSLS
jgi:catechol 2,3-dioxygenase-like lactoylglutathione lyase family enzyme